MIGQGVAVFLRFPDRKNGRNAIRQCQAGLTTGQPDLRQAGYLVIMVQPTFHPLFSTHPMNFSGGGGGLVDVKMALVSPSARR